MTAAGAGPLEARTGYTVWLADDDPASLRVLELRLTHAGYRVQGMTGGLELLARLEKADAPDLFVLDVMMPQMDGFTLCRHLRAHSRPELRQVPVVLLTALNGLDMRQKGLEAGASDFLSKPVQFWELLARLESHLRFAELSQEALSQANDTQARHMPGDSGGPAARVSLSSLPASWAERHLSGLPALFTPETSVSRRVEVGFFEPDPQHAAQLRATLEALGYGVRAYSKLPIPLDTPHPDLLLLDLGVPHHTGVATCRAFKERSSTRDLPIIVMAPADSAREGRLLAWDAGADECFEKPLERMALGVRARALLKRKLLQDQLSNSFDDLSQRASEDPLTGLANRGTFDLTLEREFTRSLAEGSPLSLLLLDVDHFKHFNDQNGHPVGDTLLRDLSNLLSSEARRRDTVARYGGEEFTFILPDAGEVEGLQVAERLQSRIRQTRFVGGEGQPGGHLTVSIGLAALPSEGVMNPIELLEKADQALYAAKNRGRDCCVSSSELNTVDSE